MTTSNQHTHVPEGSFRMRTYRTIAATATLAVALGTAVLSAPAAQAGPQGTKATKASTANLIREDGELWYKAAPGQQNRLTVGEEIEGRDGGESYYVLTFHDNYEIAISPDAAKWDECKYPKADDRTTVQCAVLIPQNSDDSDSYIIDLGDLDDTATLGKDDNAWAGVHGGPGNDTLTSSVSAMLYGEDGNDKLDGGGGPFGFGPYGGPGNDTLYRCSQDCFGGPGDDKFYGTDEDENMHGEDGNDILYGRGGNDVLYGGKGNDKLLGDAGDDTLWGNSGDDILWGGKGNDKLSGGPGRNQVHQD